MDQTLAPPAKSASPAKRWAALAVPLLILAGLAAGVLANPGLRELFVDAIHRIDPWAVAVTLPVQFIAILVCTCAQQALKVGIPFRASLIARLTRDAGHNLLIFPPALARRSARALSCCWAGGGVRRWRCACSMSPPR